MIPKAKDILHMSVMRAAKTRWQAGKEEYKGRSFEEGHMDRDPLAEAYEEALDCLAYIMYLMSGYNDPYMSPRPAWEHLRDQTWKLAVNIRQVLLRDPELLRTVGSGFAVQGDDSDEYEATLKMWE